MTRCTSCGGELISVGGDDLYCTYCGNTYSRDDLSRTKPIDKDGIRRFDIGANVFEKNIGKVLEITWSDGKYGYSGSGFVVSSDGWAVTNAHVVTGESGEHCKMVKISVGGKNTEADVVRLGDGIDLAVIKLKNVYGMDAARLADFESVRNGEQVFVIGNSLGFGSCITSGIVSDKRRDVGGKMLLMTDCAVNEGNSGGPVFNIEGEVIAVIVSGISGAEGMNFAIPIDDVISFIGSCDQRIIY